MNKTIIFLVIIIIVAIAGYFILFSGNNPPSSTQSNITATQTPNPNNIANEVVIKGFSFNPGTLNIKTGEIVIWKNEDSVVHSIKSTTFNSQNLNPGDSFQFQFKTAGTFDYSCGIHPSMKGQIIVQ